MDAGTPLGAGAAGRRGMTVALAAIASGGATWPVLCAIRAARLLGGHRPYPSVVEFLGAEAAVFVLTFALGGWPLGVPERAIGIAARRGAMVGVICSGVIVSIHEYERGEGWIGPFFGGMFWGGLPGASLGAVFGVLSGFLVRRCVHQSPHERAMRAAMFVLANIAVGWAVLGPDWWLQRRWLLVMATIWLAVLLGAVASRGVRMIQRD